MAAVTLTTLIARARQRADMPVAGFVADDATGIFAWINEGVQKIQELLVKAYGSQFLQTSSALTTVAGTTDYNLPTDLLALYGVELTIDGVRVSLSPYTRTESNLHRRLTGSRKPRYALVGMSPGVLRLLPAPSVAWSGFINYAPSATLLTTGANTVNFPNGWERYAVVYTAIQMRMKEESDVRELRIELEKMEQELEEIAIRRNADQPHSIVDIEAVDCDDNPYY